ncbi:MAG: ATP-binding cassette domain-containing protein [Lachnospiraceae bacterium]|nr:ATP-binding cassette domain-containing protein [Lachnospiraceae bacterium]
MIKLQHLNKTFHTAGGDVEALRDVSLDIPEGSIFGVIGYSGAGKSTLIRTINLLEKPDSGEVIVDGENLMDLSTGELEKKRQKIGMIFQHFNLLKGKTVFENVAFPLVYQKKKKKEIEERVTELLELVDLSDKAKAYPSQLSGGQKQRVAIARALAADPKILLCDEATSALDPQTTASILQLLARLNKKLNLTIVIITHQMSVIRDICETVAVMEDGQVVEQGDSYKIFSEPEKDITKRFVETVFNNDEISRLLTQKELQDKFLNGDRAYHLIFRGDNANKPYIADLVRKFDLDVSIIFGSIEFVSNRPIGSLYVVINGSERIIKEAISFLRQEKVLVFPVSEPVLEEKVS